MRCYPIKRCIVQVERCLVSLEIVREWPYTMKTWSQPPCFTHTHTHTPFPWIPLTPSTSLSPPEQLRISCKHATYTHSLYHTHTHVPPPPAQRGNLLPSLKMKHSDREGAANVTHHELLDSWRRSPSVLMFSFGIPKTHNTVVSLCLKQNGEKTMLYALNTHMFYVVVFFWQF